MHNVLPLTMKFTLQVLRPYSLSSLMFGLSLTCKFISEPLESKNLLIDALNIMDVWRKYEESLAPFLPVQPPSCI